MTLTDSFRRGEIDAVKTVELVYVGRLFRKGCGSLLMPVCGSVGGGFTGKGELDVRVVRAGT